VVEGLFVLGVKAGFAVEDDVVFLALEVLKA